MSVPRCSPSRRLRSGSPAAPGAIRLGLLPSGPDPVHGAPPRRTQPSTPRARCVPNGRHPQAGSSAPRIEGFGCRAPLAPRLARSREMVPEWRAVSSPSERSDSAVSYSATQTVSRNAATVAARSRGGNDPPTPGGFATGGTFPPTSPFGLLGGPTRKAHRWWA
jgi:hypothetical protein